ncbi:MAG TPA: hypothetical protein ENN69_07455 [Spirochaetia bacterium]|nr:hypothetical protein [Spirochaetia bacterium]
MIGFLSTSLFSYAIALSSHRSHITADVLPLTSDNVYSEIQRDLVRPVFISSLMATDTFLRDWVLDGEQDVVRITKYLNEIKQRYHTVTSFFVSEKTRIYYHAHGILKKVDPNEERDRWYFRVREMAADYETNLDPDMANRDTMTIFINHRVFDYQGNYIGATGVGLTMNSLITLMNYYGRKYNRNVFFIDTRGDIVLSNTVVDGSARSIADIDGFHTVADRLLSSRDGSFEYMRDRTLVYLNSRYIDELGWYLLVEQSEEETASGILSALLVNLAVCVLITGIVITFAVIVFNAYQKTNVRLQGLLPICSSCKKIRNDKGYWEQVELYLKEHTEADFTHGICPDCSRTLYNDNP